MDVGPARVQNEAHAQQISKPASGYAFLNHSSMTLPNNLPPNVDDKLVARHKRRRTRFVTLQIWTNIQADPLQSPEDQNILEAAYTRNPKPDKMERLELVKQVALGEKEVQVRGCSQLIIIIASLISKRYGSRTDDRPRDENRVRFCRTR